MRSACIDRDVGVKMELVIYGNAQVIGGGSIGL